jgi:type II secretory pathway predicted ATPase ExeA
VLAGHPKLRNDLRRPTMEEIGYRTSTFAFDGIVGQQREYMDHGDDPRQILTHPPSC